MKQPVNKVFLVFCCLLLIGACSSQKPKEEEDQIDENVSRADLSGQTAPAKYQIYVDIGHKQVFWNDPSNMDGMPDNQVERARYMTNEIVRSASAVDGQIKFIKDKISKKELEECDLLFIHIPKAKYSAREVEAITQYVKAGGSLFLVMDVDYWSTLEETNVNDLIRPFEIEFGKDSPDSLSGGYTRINPVTNAPRKITYHGGRVVNGGTPFCYNNQTEEYPFGIFKDLGMGGKLVVMGDGMVSLYMTSWQGVNDYQCQEFMQDVFTWLLE